MNICKEKKSKLHTLLKKEAPLCLHSVLGYCASKSDSSAPQIEKKSVPKLERDLTVKFVLSKIKEHFPSMSDSDIIPKFLVKNRKFVTSLMQVENLSEEINKHLPKVCHACPDSELLDWPFPSRKAYLLSNGFFQEIKIGVKTCSKCRTALYPDLFNYGLLPVHNKLMLSYDFLIDMFNQLVTGSSLVENIKSKFLLLGMCHGYKKEDLTINLTNLAKNIEKIVIATVSHLGKQF